MSKSVNIIEVLEKAHQSKARMSKKAKLSIIDHYARALVVKKELDDFIKVNRQLVIDMAFSENANLLHGTDYSIHVTQRLGAKIDNKLVRDILGDLEYHKCKVPMQSTMVQAMPIKDNVSSNNKKRTVEEITDFRISA